MNEIVPASKFEAVSLASRAIAELPISVGTGEVCELLAKQLPECSVGCLVIDGSGEPTISTVGNEEYLGELNNILNNYRRSTEHIAGENYKLDIDNADLILAGKDKLKAKCRGLIFGNFNYGLLVILSRDSRKLQKSEKDLIDIFVNLISSAAAREIGIGKPDSVGTIKISKSPRHTIELFTKEITKIAAPVMCAIGYLFPGESNAELFFSSEDTSGAIQSEFSADLTIPRAQFDMRVVQSKWCASLTKADLPQSLISELAKYDARELFFYPLKGKKNSFGFCIIGFFRRPPIEVEKNIDDLVHRFNPDFAHSASMHLILAGYRKLLDADKAGLVRLTAATVNHHVNNQLSVVLGAAQLLLLKSEEELPADIRKKIELIENNSLKIKDVISSLMNIDAVNVAEYTAGDKLIDI
ncbi:MAG: hypothetical protein GF315_00955 [candidate division Zixibacteria bacterium]|nr:hypothetical protein [candidate division Zixibacteria bacterium]